MRTHQLMTLLIIAVIPLPAAAQTQEAPPPKVERVPIGPDNLEPGDLIFSTTAELVSGGIRVLTDAKVSHSMIYIGAVDGTPTVIEAVKEGVVERPLAEALNGATFNVAIRHPRAPEDRLERAIKFAREQVGKLYDSPGILRQLLCRVALPAHAQLVCPTIHGDDALFYCSELIQKAYEHGRIPLTDGQWRWRVPESLRNGPHGAPGDLLYLTTEDGEFSMVGHLERLVFPRAKVHAESGLNVRAAPSTKADKRGALTHGAEVLITARKRVESEAEEKDWARVESAELTGWVAARRLREQR